MMRVTPREAIKTIVKRLLIRAPWLESTYFYNACRFIADRHHLQNMLIHKDIHGYPQRHGVLTNDIIPTEQDMLLTKRLLRAYKKAVIDGNRRRGISGQDVWSYLEQGPHAHFIKLLKTEDIQAITFHLCNMSRMVITHGLSQDEGEYRRLTVDSIFRNWLDRFNLDKFIALAEALSVLPYENPEQGEFGSAIFSDVDDLVVKIETLLGIPIIPPDIEGSLYKLKTKKGSIHYKDMSALYTAWRCKELLKGIQKPRICEIGAGIGKVAYYARLFGIHRYTIIDLPYVNVLQGFYLARSLPSTNIVLYGEKIGDSESFISILPDWSLDKIAGRQFDLTLNQDSFPEIAQETVRAYLHQILLHTTKYFLSVNQESQNTMLTGDLKQHVVYELVESMKKFTKIYRFPYWLRAGYVEELYGIANEKKGG